MSLRFNPLVFGGFDMVGSSTGGFTKAEAETLLEAYVKLAGRAGGQTVSGGLAEGEAPLILEAFPGGPSIELEPGGTSPRFNINGALLNASGGIEVSFIEPLTLSLEHQEAAELTGSIKTYEPSPSRSWILFEKASGAYSITGLAEPSHAGTISIITNNTAHTITLKNENSESSAEDRFHFTTGANVVLQPGQSIVLMWVPEGGTIVERWINVTEILPTVGVPEAAKSRETGKEIEVLEVTTTVYLTLKLKAESSAWTVYVDGKAVFTDTAETLVAADLNQTYTLRVKPKGKWEVKMNTGTASELHSVYQEG